MSNITYVSTDNNQLAQRLQNAEKSIAFIQREHSSTLANLHEEISKWQQKCSDLTFQLAIGGGTVINSSDDHKLRSSIEQLEKELGQCKDTIKSLSKLLEEKEKMIQDYENRLIVNERKHTAELRAENDKHRQLKIELEQRSTLIAQLTHQLYRDKQQSQNRLHLGQIILPDKPKKLKSPDESPKSLSSDKRPANRSSSLITRTSPEQDLNKVLFVGRRPPTPPQQLRPISSKVSEPTEEQLFTKRQRQLLNSHTEHADSNKVLPSRASIKLSTVLPPIINRKVPLKSLTTTTKLQQEGEA